MQKYTAKLRVASFCYKVVGATLYYYLKLLRLSSKQSIEILLKICQLKTMPPRE